MKIVPIFVVQKFFPPRCPRCEHPFSSPQDFAEYGGTGGSSFVASKIRQAKLFPELFEDLQENSPGVWASGNKFGAHFIICLHCQNVTFRIDYASSQVMTREEAVRLVATQGFTCWSEGVATGNMARPLSNLHMLGEADYAGLASRVIAAKQLASGERGDLRRADAFDGAIDPALVEVVNKYRESQTSSDASKRLHGIFGTQWEHLVPDCRDFLITAEVLKDDLASRTENDSSIDFSPAVAMYSKVLEKDLLEKLFRPFVSSEQAHRLPATGTKKDWERSRSALQAFVAGGRELTLGDMAFCLLNLGCRMRQVAENGFAEFLRISIHDLAAFCDLYKFPKRLIEYVTDYRNKSAHVAKLSKDECMAARSFLLEEPIQLLILLERFLGPQTLK